MATQHTDGEMSTELGASISELTARAREQGDDEEEDD